MMTFVPPALLVSWVLWYSSVAAYQILLHPYFCQICDNANIDKHLLSTIQMTLLEQYIQGFNIIICCNSFEDFHWEAVAWETINLTIKQLVLWCLHT